MASSAQQPVPITNEIKAWTFSRDALSFDDPLLNSLLLLAKYFHHPISAQALTAGLPLENNKLTVDVFERAAARANLSAKLVKREFDKISNPVLPAVLLLEDRQVVILTQINKNGTVQLIRPETGDGCEEMPYDDLKKTYTNFLFLVRPTFQMSQRAEETIDRSKRKHWFWSVIKESWPVYSEVFIASILVNFFALASPLFVMNVYDRVVPNHAVETLWVLAIGITLVYFFDFVLKALRSYFVDMAGKQVDLKLSASIFEQILGVRMDARPASTGAFVNTVQSFEAFRDFITSSTITVLIDLPFALLFLVVISLLGGTLALVPLVLMPIVIFVGFLLQAPLTELTKTSYKHSAEKQATLIESISNAETIKSIGAEGSMQKRWENVMRLSSRLGLKLRFITNFGVNFAMLSQNLASVIVVIFGVYKITNGEMTTGALVACTILTGRVLAPMSQIAQLMSRYFQSMHSLESVDKVMKMPTERPADQEFLHRPRFNGDCELVNVTFSYPGCEYPAVRHINLSIKAGEKVGIIGRIGSGKTTLAKLILNLYLPQEGQVLLDGIDAKQIDPADLRHYIGYVPQDVVLFYGNVKDNISIGAPHVDDFQVLRAARVSGVDAFVGKHPQGYAMQVGERGSNLSGGQRQCISIARALLEDPSLLMFDEPTNSMDDATETLIRNNLAHYLADKTLILVTHKASMLQLVDRLIVMDGGAIIDDGPKDQVIKNLTDGKLKAATKGN